MISIHELEQIEIKALERNIPVMQKEGIEFVVELLKKRDCKTLLEIGSAIGYSAMYFASQVEGLKIETIELDEKRYNEAKNNIETYSFENHIILHHDDALVFNTQRLQLNEYDCLFIDAAKAQYQKFFEKYVSFVKQNGIIIVDNLDFHGMIHDIENIKNRNTRQLVRKIKRFKDWIFSSDDYKVEYYEIGDGIVVIQRKESL